MGEAEIGVRELKVRASEVVRAVHERRVRYVVTRRGRPAAMLVPLEPPSPGQAPGTAQDPAAWDELTRLGARLARGWRSRRSSTKLLAAMRR